MRLDKSRAIGWLLIVLIVALSGCTSQKYPNLPPQIGGTITDVNADTINSYLSDTSRPTVALFFDKQYWQSEDMEGRIQLFAGKYGGSVQFLKYQWQTGDDPSRFGLQMLPTVILFKNGQELDRIKGIPKDRDTLNKWNDDIELWMLKTVFDVQGDDYSGSYKYLFKNSSTLDISGY